MLNYVINGGNKISGTVDPMPNKNSIVAIIPATILADEPVTLHNVPKSSSVRTLLKIYRSLGGKVSYGRDGSVKLDPRTIDKYVIDKDLAKKERSANMFLGPLLIKFGKAELGSIGGCKLGQRPVDTLLQGLISLGADMDPENIFNLSAKEIVGNDRIWQLEASVTGTENLIMTATKAKGRTVIYNAACEPHVQDLSNFLNSIGAKISGVGTNRIEIEGVDKLDGGSWEIIPDHIDIGGLIVAAALTGGELRIRNAIPSHMQQIMLFYKKINLICEVDGGDIIVPPDQELRCLPNLKEEIDKIVAQPWPTGFPVDLIPQLIVLAASASGNIRILNPMYENGLAFVDDLIRLRGKLMLADANKVVTFGPSDWKGGVVSAPAILQCAHAVALVGFVAKGTTKILNSDIIARRYPDFVEVFTDLGADISEE